MRFAIILFLAIGIGLFLYSMTMPAYTDASEMERWDAAASGHIGKDDWGQFTEEYYAAVSGLRTDKYWLSDLGAGIASSALLFLLLGALFNVRKFRDLQRLRSVGRWKLVVLANAAWLSAIPATCIFYIRTQSRGDYPWFADSIAIPIFAGTVSILVVLPILNLLVAVFLRGSRHPAPLISRFPRYGVSAVIIELFIGFVLFIIAMALIGAIASGDILGIVVFVALAYVFLSLRAGKANRVGGTHAVAGELRASP